MTEHEHPTGSERTGSAFTGRSRSAGIVMLVCMLLWTLLAAPRLMKVAEASPEGSRRTLALAVLEPFAWLSKAINLSEATGGLEAAVGRAPEEQAGGDLDLEAELEGADLPELPDIVKSPAEQDQPPRALPSVEADDVQRDDKLRVPTKRYKLRIAVIGDSFAEGVGDAVAAAADDSLVHVLNVGRIATGLARADYFDWVENMKKVSRRYDPDLVIVMLGGNDKQSVVFPGGRAVISGDPDWGSAYGKRISDFLEMATADAHVVWVGLPPAKDEGKSRVYEAYNSMYSSAVDHHRNAAFIDIWDGFSGSKGRYKAYGPGPGGETTLLREGDGEHFTVSGYRLIVNRVSTIITERWKASRKLFE